MLPEETISLFIFLNLLLYMGITLPLDLMTYRKGKKGHVDSEKPKRPQGIWVYSALIMSGMIWLLFLIIPVLEILKFRIFYIFLTESSPPYLQSIQLIGGLAILIGTLIAIFGRISRWNRAFSWGIPNQLETKGIYSWIRHPLYASYLFYFIGFPCIYLNVILSPLLLGIPGYYYMSIYEENILLNHFPLEYAIYKRTVKRFIPFIW